MKKHYKNSFYFLLVAVCVAILLSACKDEDEDNVTPDQRELVSEWSGIFTGTFEDGNLDFKLYSDNSISLNWQTLEAFCTGSNGTYELNGSNISFSVNGLAKSGNESSSFSMTSNGTINGNSGNGSYNIDFVDQNWDDQSGNWNVTLAGAQASINVVLNLPSAAEGKTAVVFFDNDFDVDNGVTSTKIQTCPAGSQVSFLFDNVPAGTYFVYGGVWVVGEYGDEPGPGDYLGVYGGTPQNLPEEPNAIVPYSGTKTFNIDLIILTKKSTIPLMPNYPDKL